ncbi:MAG TPA: DNA gyrase modulator [Thermoanaerobaculia bacterium]|nr:DNA gyrase modulator [Thermoanaerobaculia bacterium]
MELDASRISGWIDSLAREPHEVAEIFIERRRELVFEWRDGEVEQTRVWVASGLSARSRRQGEEKLAFVPRTDEAGVREAVRALQRELDRPPLPIKPSHAEEPATLPHLSTPTAGGNASRLSLPDSLHGTAFVSHLPEPSGR